jgi:hypothetical protein
MKKAAPASGAAFLRHQGLQAGNMPMQRAFSRTGRDRAAA